MALHQYAGSDPMLVEEPHPRKGTRSTLAGQLSPRAEFESRANFGLPDDVRSTTESGGKATLLNLAFGPLADLGERHGITRPRSVGSDYVREPRLRLLPKSVRSELWVSTERLRRGRTGSIGYGIREDDFTSVILVAYDNRGVEAFTKLQPTGCAKATTK
jgi:hypothetical protein